MHIFRAMKLKLNKKRGQFFGDKYPFKSKVIKIKIKEGVRAGELVLVD